MGSFDRDYVREEGSRMQRPPVPPVTKWLVFSNVIVFVLCFLVLGPGQRVTESPIEIAGQFTYGQGLFGGQIWRLLTFQFLHASLGHVVFNCIGLWFFGQAVERWWGSRRFLIFYLLCGAAGALFFTLLSLVHIIPFTDGLTPLVGASAGIYGMLIATYVINPHGRVALIFPPIEMSMRQAAMLWIGMAVVVIVGDLTLGWAMFSNSGGEAGHLGGALLGYLLTKKPALLGKRGKGAGSLDNILHPEAFKKKKIRQEPKLRPRSELSHQEATEIDRILDKINRDGFESLSAEDREALQRASSGTPKKP